MCTVETAGLLQKIARILISNTNPFSKMSVDPFSGFAQALPDCMQGSRFLSYVKGDICYAHQTTDLRGLRLRRKSSDVTRVHAGDRGLTFKIEFRGAESHWIKKNAGTTGQCSNHIKNCFLSISATTKFSFF